jgi:PAS domain S-box-containing protein
MASRVFVEQRYVESNRRLMHVHAVAATLIWLVALWEVWGTWPLVWGVVVAQLVLCPFNVFISLVLIKRKGMVIGESVRYLVNLTAIIAFCHVSHWPLSLWLFLPFFGTAVDQWDRRMPVVILILSCLVMDIGGIIDGTHWLIPIVFTGLAIYCAIAASARHRVIQAMFQRTDQQRLELETVLAALGANRAELASLLDNTDDAICSVTSEGTLAAFNPAFAALLLWHSDTVPQPGTPFLWHEDGDVDPLIWRQRLAQAMAGTRVRAEQILSRGETRRVLDLALHPIVDAGGEIRGVTVFARDVTGRKAAEAVAQSTQQQLLALSRQAGMADVATNVLHNVGNVLNSVNVSAGLSIGVLERSHAASVSKLASLMIEQGPALATFLTDDPRGRKIPRYLEALGHELTHERTTVMGELRSLRKNIDHIKAIVGVQQAHARVSGVAESLAPSVVLEDAIALHQAQHQDGPVPRCDFDESLIMHADRHKVMIIVTNLLSNAYHALNASEQPTPTREIKLSTRALPGSRVAITVSDNGCGISAEHLPQIFRHGFTLRPDGHGFGLHSAACVAAEMHGSLGVHSDGPGRGATFTLQLPARAATTLPPGPKDHRP